MTASPSRRIANIRSASIPSAPSRRSAMLRQRAETIDRLNARLEQSRAQCRRLDEEAEHYFKMLAAS